MSRDHRRPLPRPRPDLLRRPAAGFGWLEQALLLDGWLARLGPDGIAVLVLLALAADRHGASFYSRPRMANALGTSLPNVDAALTRLRDLGLADFAPWRSGGRDGVWQLLPIPLDCRSPPRDGRVLGIDQVLASLGFTPHTSTDDQRRHPSAPTGGAE